MSPKPISQWGMIYNLDCRWRIIFMKTGCTSKISQTRNFKTTFKKNLTCIFLSVRVNLKNTLCHEGPCIVDFSLLNISKIWKDQVIEITNNPNFFSLDFTFGIHWSHFVVFYSRLLGVPYERLHWRNWMPHDNTSQECSGVYCPASILFHIYFPLHMHIS